MGGRGGRGGKRAGGGRWRRGKGGKGKAGFPGETLDNPKDLRALPATPRGIAEIPGKSPGVSRKIREVSRESLGNPW